MLKLLRSVGLGSLILLGICAALSLCVALVNNVMLLWAALAVCSLAFSILLLWLAFSGRSYRF